MLIPLVFVAASLVVEDRKAVRTVILFTAISLLFIDRSFLTESMSRSWGTFDEDKRAGVHWVTDRIRLPHILPSLRLFFWGFAQFLKRKKIRLLSYGPDALTHFCNDVYLLSRMLTWPSSSASLCLVC